MEKDDIEKAIDDLEKAHKAGNIQGVQLYGQYLDIKLKNQQNQLNKVVIANLNKSNELLVGLKSEIENSTDRINSSNKALSDQQNSQNIWIVVFTAVMALTSVFAAIASWNSANTANLAAIQAAKIAEAQLRPYVIFEPITNSMLWDGKPTIVLSINLKNIGQTPALKILKGYNSFLQNKAGVSAIGQLFREKSGEEDALAPTQVSATHPLNIYIAGFNIEKDSSIKVEVLISYEGASEIDSKRYLSKSIYIMTPFKMPNGSIVFKISQPRLAFGLAKDGWDI